MNNRLLDPIGLLRAMSGRLPPVPLTQIDCDELTAFLLALAFSLDMPAEIVTVAADPTRPKQFTHVYLRFQDRQGGKIPFDVTAGPEPGREPSGVYRRLVWTVHTPIELSGFPESDRATAQAVAAVIASARAAASHPEFEFFLKFLARLLLEELSSLISHEQERRRETAPECRGSSVVGETQGEPLFRNLSDGDLQSLGAWLTRRRTELQGTEFDLRTLIETAPELDIPGLTPAQTAAWGRLIVDRLPALLSSHGPSRSGTR